MKITDPHKKLKYNYLTVKFFYLYSYYSIFIFVFKLAFTKTVLQDTLCPCRLFPHIVVVVELVRFSNLWGYTVRTIHA